MYLFERRVMHHVSCFSESNTVGQVCSSQISDGLPSNLTCCVLIGLVVRMLREELQLLQEPGSYVGEVVKVMGKTKVLVKVMPACDLLPPVQVTC